jgi:type I restriction enzyme S subunit
MKAFISDLFEFVRNGLNIKNDIGHGGLPITRIETIADATVNINRVGYAGLTAAEAGKYLLQDGDILFSHINSVAHLGKCAIYKNEHGPLVHGMNLLCFRVLTKSLLPNYALHLLRSKPFKTQLAKCIKKAVNQASVSVSDLKKITLEVPPLAEQQRIALQLDTADRILRLREQAIAKLDQLTQSVFVEKFMCTDKFPVVELSEICFTTSGGTPNRSVKDYYGGDICWVKSGELNAPLVLDTEERISQKGLENSSAKIMPIGTVLLAMYGATIGAVSMLGIEAATNQAICCISPDRTRLLPEFLVCFLRQHKNKLIGRAVGGAQPNINQGIVRDIKLPLPPIGEQFRFAEFIAKSEGTRTSYLESLRNIHSLQNSLQYQSFGAA